MTAMEALEGSVYINLADHIPARSGTIVSKCLNLGETTRLHQLRPTPRMMTLHQVMKPINDP
jgi:hypothetical protein